MPTHVYQPLRNPPRWVDRIMVHPWDNTIGLLSLVFGLLLGVALWQQGFSPSVSLLRMPPGVPLVVCFLLTSGGALALLGVNWNGDTVSLGWAIERFGWLAVSAGMAWYSISVVWHYPGSTFSWGVPAILALGAFLRFLSLVLIERNTRKTLVAVRREAEDYL